jgi:hypothetical protein
MSKILLIVNIINPENGIRDDTNDTPSQMRLRFEH